MKPPAFTKLVSFNSPISNSPNLPKCC